MAKQVEIDTRNFNRMVKDLAFIKGKDLRTVIREEATAILSKSLRTTKAARVAKIKSQEKKLQEWFQKQADKKKWISPVVRKRMLEKRRAQIAKRLSMRGLAKGTFYLIGEHLGLKIDAPKYVLTAVAGSRGKLASALSGKEEGTNRYAITMKNASIVAMTYNAGGFRAFKRAINGRVAHFKKQVQHGFKERAKKAAKGQAKVT